MGHFREKNRIATVQALAVTEAVRIRFRKSDVILCTKQTIWAGPSDIDLRSWARNGGGYKWGK
jgi:hypothetical protein